MISGLLLPGRGTLAMLRGLGQFGRGPHILSFIPASLGLSTNQRSIVFSTTAIRLSAKDAFSAASSGILQSFQRSLSCLIGSIWSEAVILTVRSARTWAC